MSFVVRNDRMFNAFIVAVVIVVVVKRTNPFLFAARYTDSDDNAGDNLTTMQSIIHLEEQMKASSCIMLWEGEWAKTRMPREPSHKVDIHQMLFVFISFSSEFLFFCISL